MFKRLIKKLLCIHSPSKLLIKESRKAIGEAQIYLKEWEKDNHEEIKKFQSALDISPHFKN